MSKKAMAQVVCKCCNKTFNKYPNQILKTKSNFCSRSCAAKITNCEFPKRALEGKCSSCNKAISISNKFCKSCLQIKSFSQKTKGEVCAKSKGGGCSRIRQHARNVAKNHGILNSPCAKCGYVPHTQICHIKPIKLFPSTALISEINEKTNLIQLCPNCHWEFDHL